MIDDAPNVYAAVAVTLPLGTLALALRLYCRSITKAGYWYDDGLAVLGWVCLHILSIYLYRRGLTGHYSWALLAMQ